MKPLLQKTVYGLLIFAIIPVLFPLFIGSWSLTWINFSALPLYWITETASTPYVLITAPVLAILFIARFYDLSWRSCPFKKVSFKQLLMLGLVLVLAVMLGQAVKVGLKMVTAQPRPYVVQLSKVSEMTPELFYQQEKSAQHAWITEQAEQHESIPAWLAGHWHKETSYSFPSGHTIFATTWGFLALLFFPFRRHPWLISSIMAWGVLMQLSRLMLGVHYAMDIYAGTILAAIIALFCHFVARQLQLVDVDEG